MSDNVYDRVRDKAARDSNEERLEAILSDLRSRVNNDASILMTFVDILKVDLKRQDLADKIMSKLNQSEYVFISKYSLYCFFKLE